MTGLDCNLLVQLALQDHPANAATITAVQAEVKRGSRPPNRGNASLCGITKECSFIVGLFVFQAVSHSSFAFALTPGYFIRFAQPINSATIKLPPAQPSTCPLAGSFHTASRLVRQKATVSNNCYNLSAARRENRRDADAKQCISRGLMGDGKERWLVQP